MHVTSEQVKVEKLEEEVAKVEKENEMQDLTIGALKAMTSERFTSVVKNQEAINSGNERLFQNHFFVETTPRL